MMTADYIQKFMGSMILSAGIHLINPISFTNRDTKNGGKEMKEKEKKNSNNPIYAQTNMIISHN